ncbi:hypothetical protein M501DRAFT_1026835 [Patellaria atrata CBS 101060]|uniref:Nudix hydrolase domain-containing protein n=1 Tax=Patellaria atrata CBS 101060 TaxID=1346257 RepID=A0A9P4VJI8_9PEZI|nr:hypothetical protein M501DRAFT_1026835 [Patellaria atrata CBS 101060]
MPSRGAKSGRSRKRSYIQNPDTLSRVDLLSDLTAVDREQAVPLAEETLSSIYKLVDQVDAWPYLQKSLDGYRTHLNKYFYFLVEGYEHPLGYILETSVNQIQWPKFWTVDLHKRLLVLSQGSGIEERDRFMEATIQQIHERGEISDLRKLSDEYYGAFSNSGELVLRMNRSAAGLFGIRTFGVFLIAYVNTEQGRKFWVAQRSRGKMTYPCKLDMCVGGSLRADEAPIDCLVREAAEESSLPTKHTRTAIQASGALTYHMAVDDYGRPASRPQTQFVYELELPVDMIPRPCDDEVEAFKLMSLGEIKMALEQQDFKSNIAMTWVDYFIRHGEIDAENESKFVEICSRLHRNLDHFVI